MPSKYQTSRVVFSLVFAHFLPGKFGCYVIVGGFSRFTHRVFVHNTLILSVLAQISCWSSKYLTISREKTEPFSQINGHQTQQPLHLKMMTMVHLNETSAFFRKSRQQRHSRFFFSRSFDVINLPALRTNLSRIRLIAPSLRFLSYPRMKDTTSTSSLFHIQLSLLLLFPLYHFLPRSLWSELSSSNELREATSARINDAGRRSSRGKSGSFSRDRRFAPQTAVEVERTLLGGSEEDSPSINSRDKMVSPDYVGNNKISMEAKSSSFVHPIFYFFLCEPWKEPYN